MTRTFSGSFEHAGTSTMLRDSESEAEHRFPIKEKPVTETVPPESSFAQLVISLGPTTGRRRDTLRSEIIDHILRSFSPNDEMDLTVRTLLMETYSGRIDDAIDILSGLGAVAGQFGIRTLTCTPGAIPNDDYGYVIVRAIGRTVDATTAMLILRSCSHWSAERAIREGAVEALSELRTSESINCLQEIAERDDSPFIRELAAEALSECAD